MTFKPKDTHDLWSDSGWTIAGLVKQANGDVSVSKQVENQGMAINRPTAGVYSRDSNGLNGGIAVSQGSVSKLPLQAQPGFGYYLVSGDKAGAPAIRGRCPINGMSHKYYWFGDCALKLPVQIEPPGSIPTLTAALQASPR